MVQNTSDGAQEREKKLQEQVNASHQALAAANAKNAEMAVMLL